MEMLIEGVLSIQNGENPQLVRKRLESFTLTHRQSTRPVVKEGLMSRRSKRRGKREPGDHRDRWMITYADLITLLLIFL